MDRNIIVIIAFLLARRLQVTAVQRHGNDVLIERRHYPTGLSVDRLDDVQRPDRKRSRVVRGEIHFFDVDELGRSVGVGVQRAFNQPPVVCEHDSKLGKCYLGNNCIGKILRCCFLYKCVHMIIGGTFG